MSDLSASEIGQQLNTKVNQLKREYQRGINKDLTQHQWQGLFERQLLQTLAGLFDFSSELNGKIKPQANDSEAIVINQYLIEQTELYRDILIEYALQFNRSSCALSNFPAEHIPSRDYLNAVLAKIDQRWRIWHAEVTADSNVLPVI